MQVLTVQEIDQVSGAVDGSQVATGVAVVAGAVLAVAALPVTVSVGVVGAALGASAAGGWMIGNGLVT